MKTTSKKYILRGCRSNFILGLNPNAANKLDKYQNKYDADPIAEETIVLGKEVMEIISEAKKQEWKMIKEIDMKRNSYKAW